MGGEPATLTVGDSSACKWDLTKTVTISGFKPGKDKLVFGRNAKGLTPEQLARVGFDDPAGMLYTAGIGVGRATGPRRAGQGRQPALRCLARGGQGARQAV